MICFRTCDEEHALLTQVKQMYQLASITRDVNITWQQMKYCCLRLVADPRNVDVTLAGCHVKVTVFYSIMADGEICIPWNWKGYFDNTECDDGLWWWTVMKTYVSWIKYEIAFVILIDYDSVFCSFQWYLLMRHKWMNSSGVIMQD